MIRFFSPGVKHYSNEYHENDRIKFISASVTGKTCYLNCAHCGRKLLITMWDCSEPDALLDTAKRLKQQGAEGLLISGGADKNGAVPLRPFLPAIAQIKKWGLKIICHTGVADDDLLIGLKDAGVDRALIDIIGSTQTVRHVYGIDKEPEDYERCLKTCAKIGLQTAPHIILGLDYGLFDGEYKALEMVSKFDLAFLVIVVIKPLRGTKMEDIILPPYEKCAEFFALARERNPKTVLSLGCARPAGEYAKKLEKAAVDLEFDAIAYPAPETIRYAIEKGHEIDFRDVCCGLG